MYLVGDYQAKYQGKWNNGKMNGNGTYYYIDGRIYKGGWSDGVQVKHFVNLAEKFYKQYIIERCRKYDLP